MNTVRRGVIIVALLLGTSVWGPSLSVAGILDQALEPGGSTLTFGNSFLLAQTFTAGLTGDLDRVDLWVLLPGPDPGTQPLFVEIRTTESGVPTNTVLTSATVTGVPSGASGDLLNVQLPPVPINAGTQYAIVLDAAAVYAYRGGAGDYPGGTGFTGPNNGAMWSAQGDFAFRTYVTPLSDLEVCSVLGNDQPPSRLDQDIFTFQGTAGEQVTVTVEADGDSDGNYAALVVAGGTKRKPLLKTDSGALPNTITTKLPVTGTYKILFTELPKIGKKTPLLGDYCVTLESSGDAQDTLETTSSVE
jgi:hypothetical protein